MRQSMRTRVGAALAVLAVAALPACDLDLPAPPAAAGTGTSASSAVPPPAPRDDAAPSTSPAAPLPTPPGTAAAALAELPVKGRAPRTGYDRELFGAGWGDPDRNGCDARNDVLARDLTGETFRPGTRDCVVASGTLVDPYSGATIAFRRGQGTSEAVQIDHVVAVSDAWQKGAQGWPPARRVAFYNDPLNLLAVDGPLNAQKGDGDAATWLPPARGGRCAYVARQIAVKSAYALWVTAAERDAMARVLAACPAQQLPAGGAAPPSARADAAPAPRAGTPFENCAAARAAGATPVRRGDPGYGGHLDGDGDGVACE
jgi:Excalibur calcium-binding domain/Protein of unknown function (DUF1524)